MRFTGNSDAKADAKGRVFLPAAFRKILLTAGESGLILRRDVFQQCLVIYPLSVWDKLVDSITERTNPFDRQGRENLRRFVAGSESLSLDSDGRILIPRRYLEAAGITNEVRFIGMDNTIEVWNRQAADDMLANDADLGDSLETMMNPTGLLGL
ncbi:MAG: division/cell wall cluster transcriptional repressor MraZ [Bacteroidaceae bacterium]|nr:division/cell wall cluster transcriptional repressor MraZ [Bacteroidaceae bacterium]